jgi:hypothetical protein
VISVTAYSTCSQFNRTSGIPSTSFKHTCKYFTNLTSLHNSKFNFGNNRIHVQRKLRVHIYIHAHVIYIYIYIHSTSINAASVVTKLCAGSIPGYGTDCLSLRANSSGMKPKPCHLFRGSGFFLQQRSGCGMKLTIYHHLAPTLRIRGSYTSTPRTSTRRGAKRSAGKTSPTCLCALVLILCAFLNVR